MESNVLEILVLLIRQYPEGAISKEEFEPLTEDLLGLGYTRREIEAALFWFYNNNIEDNAVSQASDSFDSNAHRILHDLERSILSPEAYGYLLELRQLGILNLIDMNEIIEKAVLLGGRQVNLDEMKLFVVSHIMGQNGIFTDSGDDSSRAAPFEKLQ